MLAIRRTTTATKLRGAGGELRVANLNADVRSLFELTKVDTMVRVEHDDSGDVMAG